MGETIAAKMDIAYENLKRARRPLVAWLIFHHIWQEICHLSMLQKSDN
jgi:hypothetical protein